MSESQKKEIVVFVNLTRQCNLNCSKCFITEENRYSNRERLPFEHVEKMLNNRYFKNPYANVVIIWEGGEPTVVGKEFFTEHVEQVARILPNAKQRMVTNCLNMPDWVLDLAKKHFDSFFETTLALGHKETLDGSEEKYLTKFTASLKKTIDAGVECPINVELNGPTINAGPGAIIDIARETGAKIWEFDISIDFKKFLANPTYDLHTYPILPLNVSYAQFSDYVIDFFSNYRKEIDELGIQSTFIAQAEGIADNLAFGVMRELDFFTLNPDGTVTTNPLFTDMPMTYLGNLTISDFSVILNHKNRRKRARVEQKRVHGCLDCEFFAQCKGGPSHAMMHDGSGECAGGYRIWKHLQR